MANHPSKRPHRNAVRIDVAQEAELRGWAKRFGVTAEQLKAAVSEVGTRADLVEVHLQGRSSDDRRHLSSRPTVALERQRR